jgi:hypothetical protein
MRTTLSHYQQEKIKKFFTHNSHKYWSNQWCVRRAYIERIIRVKSDESIEPKMKNIFVKKKRKTWNMKTGCGQHNYSVEDKKEQRCDADYTTVLFQCLSHLRLTPKIPSFLVWIEISFSDFEIVLIGYSLFRCRYTLIFGYVFLLNKHRKLTFL